MDFVSIPLEFHEDVLHHFFERLELISQREDLIQIKGDVSVFDYQLCHNFMIVEINYLKLLLIPLNNATDG